MTETLRSTWKLIGLIPDSQHVILTKLARNRRGARPVTLHVPVPDAALFQRLLAEVTVGDEITAVIVDEPGDQRRFYLRDYERAAAPVFITIHFFRQSLSLAS